MDACEGEFAAAGNVEVGIRRPHLTGADVDPSHQTKVFLKEQIALGGSLRHEQSGHIVGCRLHEKVEVDVAQNIHIVNKDGLIRIEERPCLSDTSTCLEQFVRLVADTDIHTEVVVIA